MDIKKFGYVIIKNAFKKENVKKIKHDIEKIFYTYKKSDMSFDNHLINLFKNDFNGFVGCANVCQYLPSLFNLSSSEEMLNILYSVGIELPVLNTRPLLSFSSEYTAKSENYWKVPAHQDWHSMQGSINAVTCWIPLVDVNNDMGSLQILPCSHLSGKVDHLDNGVPYINNFVGDFVSVPLNVGDAVLFNTFTIHKSGNNITKKIRLSAHFRYDDCAESTFIDRKYPKHRIEKRKDGELYPDFPSKEIIKSYFSSSQ